MESVELEIAGVCVILPYLYIYICWLGQSDLVCSLVKRDCVMW